MMVNAAKSLLRRLLGRFRWRTASAEAGPTAGSELAAPAVELELLPDVGAAPPAMHVDVEYCDGWHWRSLSGVVTDIDLMNDEIRISGMASPDLVKRLDGITGVELELETTFGPVAELEAYTVRATGYYVRSGAGFLAGIEGGNPVLVSHPDAAGIYSLEDAEGLAQRLHDLGFDAEVGILFVVCEAGQSPSAVDGTGDEE